jgi:hypothetical protein
MSRRNRRQPNIPKQDAPTVDTPLDRMTDGCEFENLLHYKKVNVDLRSEIRKSLSEIKAIRYRPAICCLANVVNTGVKASNAIDLNDVLPFSEMIATIPDDQKNLDILLVTCGMPLVCTMPLSSDSKSGMLAVDQH